MPKDILPGTGNSAQSGNTPSKKSSVWQGATNTDQRVTGVSEKTEEIIADHLSISSPDTDIQSQTASQVKEVKKKVKQASGGGNQNIKFIIKATTGHPSSPLNTGVIEINTFDNKIFMYADGGWRQLALW